MRDGEGRGAPSQLSVMLWPLGVALAVIGDPPGCTATVLLSGLSRARPGRAAPHRPAARMN